MDGTGRAGGGGRFPRRGELGTGAKCGFGAQKAPSSPGWQRERRGLLPVQRLLPPSPLQPPPAALGSPAALSQPHEAVPSQLRSLPCSGRVLPRGSFGCRCAPCGSETERVPGEPGHAGPGRGAGAALPGTIAPGIAPQPAGGEMELQKSWACLQSSVCGSLCSCEIKKKKKMPPLLLLFLFLVPVLNRLIKFSLFLG